MCEGVVVGDHCRYFPEQYSVLNYGVTMSLTFLALLCPGYIEKNHSWLKFWRKSIPPKNSILKPWTILFEPTLFAKHITIFNYTIFKKEHLKCIITWVNWCLVLHFYSTLHFCSDPKLSRKWHLFSSTWVLKRGFSP